MSYYYKDIIYYIQRYLDIKIWNQLLVKNYIFMPNHEVNSYMTEKIVPKAHINMELYKTSVYIKLKHIFNFWLHKTLSGIQVFFSPCMPHSWRRWWSWKVQGLFAFPAGPGFCYHLSCLVELMKGKFAPLWMKQPVSYTFSVLKF